VLAGRREFGGSRDDIENLPGLQRHAAMVVQLFEGAMGVASANLDGEAMQEGRVLVVCAKATPRHPLCNVGAPPQIVIEGAAVLVGDGPGRRYDWLVEPGEQPPICLPRTGA
jgi:hypothetical protein